MPQSSTFNAACYTDRYPDIKQGWKGDPYQHYQLYGQAEGRVPGCDLAGTTYATEFNEAAYLARYPDVKLLWKGAAIDHYKASGQQQGRKPGYEILTAEIPAGAMVSPGTTINKIPVVTPTTPPPVTTPPATNGNGTTVDNLVTPKTGTSTVTDTVAAVKDAATQAAAKVTTEAKKMPVGVWIGLGVLALVAVIVIAKK